MPYRRIGAPNSIARYAANTTWGNNEWAVFEYIDGQGLPVVRAAGKKTHCQHYLANPNCHLVDIRPYKVYQEQ